MPQFKNIRSWKAVGLLIFQILLDAAMIILSLLIALHLRFDMRIPQQWMGRFAHLWPVATVVCIFMFAVSRMYRSLWRYAGLSEGMRIVMGTFSGVIISYCYSLITYTINPSTSAMLPQMVYAIWWMVMLLFVGLQRFSVRMVNQLGVSRRAIQRDRRRRVMVVGAGWAGSSTIRELVARGYREGMPVVAVDDDPMKAGTHIGPVPVIYGIENIPDYAQRYSIDDIIIAIPSATKQQSRAIMDACTATSCKLKMVPGIRDVTGGEMRLGQMRDVNITDLLYRDEVRLDMASISEYITDRVVLVTGGGGSIGSELCRQIAPFHPAQLVIFDIYENNAYELCNELKVRYGEGINLRVLIGSVRDMERLEDVFESVKPDVVFHAAAHKHVPLMEYSPAEAVKNNVFGTLNVARCADKYKVDRMVILSTDKAVNPTNVMGATKRATEMIIQYMAKRSSTRYMAVRFGNVLGSNGSVIPLFRQQIAAGGPITVTHPDITRYFMTIPEAAQLVLQAGALGESGNVYVLDMGTPVKIADLARNLIRLSGLRPDEDIKIEYVGLRPGEKLYEELMMAEERDKLGKTHHEKIFILHPIPLDDAQFEAQLDTLLRVAHEHPDQVRAPLSALVPTYRAGNKAAKAG